MYHVEGSLMRSSFLFLHNKDPCEFFTEVFAFYMTTQSIPDRCKKLLDKSLEFAAGRKKASVDGE